MTNHEKIKNMQEKHEREINNPKIHINDCLYHENMVNIVKEKSNWHLYYEEKTNFIYSIAVVPSCKSSTFGTVSYFKKWYNFRKKMNPDINEYITKKGKELLNL